MTGRACRSSLAGILVVGACLLAQKALGQADFDAWLGERIENQRAAKLNEGAVVVGARIDQRSPSNQATVPSSAASTTSLVDTSSVSDLASVALSLSDLSSQPGDSETTSMASTVSAYAVRAAVSREDPLNPSYYNAHRDWRRVSFTLGFDFPEDDDAEISERATILGLKFLPYDKRDATDPENRALIEGEVSDALAQATREFAGLRGEVVSYLQTALTTREVAPPMKRSRFAGEFLSADFSTKTLPHLTDDDLAQVDTLIAARLDPFVNYTLVARDVAQRIRTKPQISIQGVTKQRGGGDPDDYRAGVIGEIGLPIGDALGVGNPNLTFNGSFDQRSRSDGEDDAGATFATELRLPLWHDPMEGREPWALSAAFVGSWMESTKPLYEGQAKVTVPLWEGFFIPIGVSWMSREEDGDDDDHVVFRVDIAADLAKMALGFRGP